MSLEEKLKDVEMGTGTESSAFGGTSGAAPMVAGSAALLLQKFPMATPPELKARLMNAANSAVYTNPATQPGVRRGPNDGVAA